MSQIWVKVSKPKKKKIQIPTLNNIGTKTNGLGAKKGCLGAMTKIDPCCLGLRMGALKPP